MGDVRKRRVGPPSLFASAFGNGLADRKSAFKGFYGNNGAASRPNFMNFRPVISEFTLLKRAIFAAMHPEILGRSSYVTLSFPDGLEDRNFDFSRVISNHLCTPYRNLVRFCSVIQEFKT